MIALVFRSLKKVKMGLLLRIGWDWSLYIPDRSIIDSGVIAELIQDIPGNFLKYRCWQTLEIATGYLAKHIYI
jgi:hypothetical protein